MSMLRKRRIGGRSPRSRPYDVDAEFYVYRLHNIHWLGGIGAFQAHSVGSQ